MSSFDWTSRMYRWTRGAVHATPRGVSRQVASLFVAGTFLLGSAVTWAQPPGPPQNDPRLEERMALEKELDSIKRRLMELQGPEGPPHRPGDEGPGPGAWPDGRPGEQPEPPEVQEHRRQAAEHLAQAVRHLRAIGADQPARRLEAAMQGLHRGGMQHPGEPGPFPESSPEGRPGRGPWGQLAEQGMREVHGKLQALRQTVEKLERRTAESQEVGEAADEAHRKVEKLHRMLEARTQELEKHLDNRSRELEKLFHAHAEKWHHEHQATVEKLRRELDERFGMVKKHLHSLESRQMKEAERAREWESKKKDRPKDHVKKQDAEHAEHEGDKAEAVKEADEKVLLAETANHDQGGDEEDEHHEKKAEEGQDDDKDDKDDGDDEDEHEDDEDEEEDDDEDDEDEEDEEHEE